VGNYHQSPFPDLYSHPAHRDSLWALLTKSRVTAYLCGHIHFYCRGTVGNGGADTVAFDASLVDRAVTLHYPKQSRVNAADIWPGYVVVTVDRNARAATAVQKVFNERTGKWEVRDSFTLRGRN